ncbi:Glyoxalase/Bleomycin resistance protein/Dioxygenase superfamily protein [Pigmentiphaga humi]|uniref:Glyoxalase/Bleomycin resistance protein/Dioxygenase superfamily protein n=1 Tax=Pigmentiphaga humi TaxID=2478468 RepID=A0A3P4B297_9BURK|nr:VOC family protein [Pigmentiphaga humi]VCU70414.1 Glyoxalase/Bleomycin resistance protein/Dioxygenase superfamily protein [Pigmentiphaga humi]
MTIERIESVTYGVEDVELCTRFMTDVGLEPVDAGRSGATFRTPVNQFVRILRADDASLPPRSSAGSNVREVAWGVGTQAALDALAAELGRDREVSVDAGGVVRTRDESGYGVALRLSDKVEAADPPRRTNQLGHVERRNEGVTPYGRARPLRIVHAAWDVLDAGHEQAQRFYLDRLRFRAIDTVRPMGTFMQCEGDIEHHNLLLCHRTNALGINHIAFEVHDIDEVVEGGNYMIAQGWKESRRLGRHNLGSNVFRMFQSPAGGRIEFASDMDRMDKDFVPRHWEKTPQHHLWMLKIPGDSEPH